MSLSFDPIIMIYFSAAFALTSSQERLTRTCERVPLNIQVADYVDARCDQNSAAATRHPPHPCPTRELPNVKHELTDFITMALHLLLLLISFALALNATSPLSTSGPWCAVAATTGRTNPHPTDCLTLGTFILATTSDRSQYVQFSHNPHDGQMRLPFVRQGGTCEVFVIITADDPTPDVPVTSSIDEVMRSMLCLIGNCLLNNQAEAKNFGGIMLIGVSDRLTVGIHSIRANGGSDTLGGNVTLELGNVDSWVQNITHS